MSVPELKQIRDLSLSDFQRHPVWVGVHNLDFGEPWYEGTDEDTYRPWMGEFPVPAKSGVVRVHATLELRDGSVYPGHVRAVPEDWDVPPPPRRMGDGQLAPPRRSPSARHGGSPLTILGYQQPCIFVNDRWFSFWGGHRGVPVEWRQAFYVTIAKVPNDVFPLRFYADPRLATGILSGQVDGFYRGPFGQAPEVEL